MNHFLFSLLTLLLLDVRQPKLYATFFQGPYKQTENAALDIPLEDEPPESEEVEASIAVPPEEPHLEEAQIQESEEPFPEEAEIQEPASEETDSLKQEEQLSACGVLTVRHIEAGGIGYEHGYSSLTGRAFIPTGSWILPFFDVRGHEFNNNTQAANAGCGVRFAFFPLENVFGFNVYYDYRNTEHGHYNQIGAGFEFLSERIDVRLNGYLPVGEKDHIISHCVFDHYEGGYVMSRKKIEVALGGANLEMGAFLGNIHSTTFYAAAGPYYFNGEVCHHVLGGEFRIEIAFNKYFFIEGRVSHDNVFETKVQGLVGISLPLGCKPSQKNRRGFPEDLAAQRVERHEIIVLDKKCRWETNF